MESRFLMGRKNFFSLIEIAVAMAVASIGVAAIMALLPLAVKSSSDSIGDTLSTDVANTILAEIDNEILKDFDYVKQHAVPYSKYNAAFHKKSNYPQRDFDAIPPISNDKCYDKRDEETGHSLFVFGPKGKPIEFAADVWVFYDDTVELSKLTVEDSSSKLKRFKPEGKGKQSAFARVYIEISWPVTKPYYVSTDKKTYSYPRQTRLFVREYFDPAYTDAEKD